MPTRSQKTLHSEPYMVSLRYTVTKLPPTSTSVTLTYRPTEAKAHPPSPQSPERSGLEQAHPLNLPTPESLRAESNSELEREPGHSTGGEDQPEKSEPCLHLSLSEPHGTPLEEAPTSLRLVRDVTFPDTDPTAHPFSHRYTPPVLEATPGEYGERHPARSLKGMRDHSTYDQTGVWAGHFDHVMGLVVCYHDVWRALQVRKKLLLKEHRRATGTGPGRRRKLEP